MSGRTSTARAPRRAPAAGGRRRVADALARSTVRERLVLALLLVERLTPGEVAHALDCPRRRVDRIYRSLLGELRATLGTNRGGRPSREIARAALALEARMPRAS